MDGGAAACCGPPLLLTCANESADVIAFEGRLALGVDAGRGVRCCRRSPDRCVHERGCRHAQDGLAGQQGQQRRSVSVLLSELLAEAALLHLRCRWPNPAAAAARPVQTEQRHQLHVEGWRWIQHTHRIERARCRQRGGLLHSLLCKCNLHGGCMAYQLLRGPEHQQHSNEEHVLPARPRR